MRPSTILAFCFLVFNTAFMSGCSFKMHQAHWPPEHEALNSSPGVAELQDAAIEKFQEAGSKDALLESIESFETILEIAPGNKEVLTYLCNQYILLGAAYTSERGLKYEYYDKAMTSCEQSMYTNLEFRREVNRGSKPWGAAYTLKAEDAPAMLFWVTALQYQFKEAMLWPSKVVNIRWMQHALLFLDRIKEVAPDYGNGAVELAYTVCYCVLPGFYGGDQEKCYGYMSKAVERSEGHLLARWGRGRFFYQVTGDENAAKKDLKWVIEQNPAKFKDVYPWRVYFQEDAALAFLRLSE